MSDKKTATSRQPKWDPPDPAGGRGPVPEGGLSVEEQAQKQAQIKGNDVLYRLYREGKAGPPPTITADNGETDLVEKLALALQAYKVERTDDLALQFTGYLVGWNEVDLSVPRGTRVTVFVTRSNKIVTAVHQWQRSAKHERVRHAAGVHTSADQAFAWLLEDGGNRLGRASKEAWEMACQVWPALQGCDVEVID